MSRIADYIKIVQQNAFLEKVGEAEKTAQMGGFSQGMVDIAQPLLYGLGGYGLSKALGGEGATGVPDWLLGPAAGIGIGMPLVNAARQGIGGMMDRRRQEQQMMQQRAEIEAAMQQDAALQAQMQQQSQQMLQQLAMQQMGANPMMGMQGGPGMEVMASYRRHKSKTAATIHPSQMADRRRSDIEKVVKGGRVGAGVGALAGGVLGTLASRGKDMGKAERALAILGGTGGGTYVGRTMGELLGPHVSRKKEKSAAIKPKPPTSVKVPAEQAEQLAQQAGQRIQQQMQAQQRQQMQQAATAQLIKGQFRGLQDRQRRAMKQARG